MKKWVHFIFNGTCSFAFGLYFPVNASVAACSDGWESPSVRSVVGQFRLPAS